MPGLAEAIASGATVVRVADIRALPVIPRPGKIICVGLKASTRRLISALTWASVLFGK